MKKGERWDESDSTADSRIFCFKVNDECSYRLIVVGLFQVLDRVV